ncbi:MAG TPA: alpha/beta fold hydrolase [Burkholderiales bacterium]|nr:alpha/beta fold hydrolase [Burkholderiales bacterium]
MTRPRVLLLPGRGNSGPDHWQTYWERAFPEFERVIQSEWETPDVRDWIENLHEAITRDSRPSILVAHSLACCLVAHWAAVHSGPIKGALLVAPSDVDAPAFPPGPIGFSPVPLQPLPFRSIVVASTDDERVSVERSRQFATAWQAEYVLLGKRGHIGSAAKLGAWPEGMELLNRLRGA